MTDRAVVVKCSSGGSFTVGGLPAGTYGVTYTTASACDVDLPDQTIDPGQAVGATIPQAAVLTVYSKPVQSDNQPPPRPPGNPGPVHFVRAVIRDRGPTGADVPPHESSKYPFPQESHEAQSAQSQGRRGGNGDLL